MFKNNKLDISLSEAAQSGQIDTLRCRIDTAFWQGEPVQFTGLDLGIALLQDNMPMARLMHTYDATITPTEAAVLQMAAPWPEKSRQLENRFQKLTGQDLFDIARQNKTDVMSIYRMALDIPEHLRESKENLQGIAFHTMLSRNEPSDAWHVLEGLPEFGKHIRTEQILDAWREHYDSPKTDHVKWNLLVEKFSSQHPDDKSTVPYLLDNLRPKIQQAFIEHDLFCHDILSREMPNYTYLYDSFRHHVDNCDQDFYHKNRNDLIDLMKSAQRVFLETENETLRNYLQHNFDRIHWQPVAKSSLLFKGEDVKIIASHVEDMIKENILHPACLDADVRKNIRHHITSDKIADTLDSLRDDRTIRSFGAEHAKELLKPQPVAMSRDKWLLEKQKEILNIKEAYKSLENDYKEIRDDYKKAAKSLADSFNKQSNGLSLYSGRNGFFYYLNEETYSDSSYYTKYKTMKKYSSRRKPPKAPKP